MVYIKDCYLFSVLCIIIIILITIFCENYAVYAFDSTLPNVNKVGIRTPADIIISENVIFIANIGSDSISIIDGSNHKLIKHISIAKINEILDPNMTNYSLRIDPKAITYNPNSRFLYVTGASFANTNGGSIVGINIDSNELTINKLNISETSIPLTDIKTNPNSHLIYATNKDSLIVIDSLSNQIIKSISIDDPHNIELNEKTGKIYVTTFKNKIAVINEENDYDIEDLILFRDPNALSINKKTNTIYVVNKDANRLAIINGSTNDIQETLLLEKYSMEESSSDLTLNENTNKIYISDKSGNTITVIDGSLNKIIKSIPIDAPGQIEVNEETNEIYSINFLSDSLSVIDGKNDVRIIGKDPYDVKSGIELTNFSKGEEKHLAFNEVTNKIYVLQNTSLFVIDEKTDNLIKKIKLGHPFYEIHIDTYNNKIFLFDFFDSQISIVDGTSYSVLDPIKIPINEMFIDKYNSRIYFLDVNNTIIVSDSKNNYSKINSYSLPKINPNFNNLLISSFAVDSKNDIIFLVDDFQNLLVTLDNKLKVINIIKVGELPRKILINPFTSLVYILNQNSDSISVIDEYTNKVIKNITVGTFPISMDIDTKTNTIYVTNEHSDSVSIIDGNLNEVVGNIDVGKFPTDIIINPITQLVYVVNKDSENISLIDAIKKTIMTGLKFEINPLNAGYIVCNKQKISNFTDTNYIRYPFNSEVDCIATATKGYEFAFWSGNLINDLKESHAKLKATQFGNIKANFRESTSVDFTIPFDTLIQIILIVVTAIVGWLIPSIVSFINNIRQRPLLINYVKLINDAKDKSSLERIKKNIINFYAKGKLSESNFNLLNNRITEILENFDNSKNNT